jgi:selenophosphate synthetase-related protein
MRTMAIKAPTRRQITSLVGGKPLAQSFNAETGDLVVIGPSGKKFRFVPEDWQKTAEPDAKENEKPKQPKKPTSGGKKST